MYPVNGLRRMYGQEKQFPFPTEDLGTVPQATFP